jgi:hypothetical protein
MLPESARNAARVLRNAARVTPELRERANGIALEYAPCQGNSVASADRPTSPYLLQHRSTEPEQMVPERSCFVPKLARFLVNRPNF